MKNGKKNAERLKKVVAWRLCSIALTLMIIWTVQGNIAEATILTGIIQIIHLICHWTFEWIWEDVLPNDLNR